MSGQPSDVIRVQCACGTKLKLPAATAGKMAKCPRCDAVFTVPSVRRAEPPAPAHSPKDDHADSLLDSLLNLSDTPPAPERSLPPRAKSSSPPAVPAEQQSRTRSAAPSCVPAAPPMPRTLV